MSTETAEAKIQAFRTKYEQEHERRMREDPAYREECAESERREAARQERERINRERSRQAGLESLRSSRGIPRHTWRHLDKPDETEALRTVRAFAADPARLFLFLSAAPGTGKTVAAASWASEQAMRQKWNGSLYTDGGLGGWDEVPISARFVPAMELVRNGTFDRDFWDDLESLDRIVLDDLGMEPHDDKGRALANITDLLTQRHAWERKTVVTTNLPLDTFRARYLAHDGGRLYDRIREAGTFYEIAGKSMRRPATQETR